MSLHWPSELRLLTYVIGQVWPDGDEDKMFAMAQGWLDAAAVMESSVAPALRAAEQQALRGYVSGSGRAFIATELDKLVVGEQSIEQLAANFRQIGTSTRHAATTIEETKIMIILSVTMLAAQIAGAWLWPPTAPAVEAAAIGATRATVYRVSNRALAVIGEIPHLGEQLVKVLRYLPRLSDEPGRVARILAQRPTAVAARATPGLYEGFVGAGLRGTTARALAELPADTVKFLLEKGINNVIVSGGLDVMVQGIQLAEGHRDEFNTTELGMSIAASVGGWYAGALVATHVGRFGAKFLTGLGKDPTAGLWGAGLGMAAGTVPTVVSTLVGGGIAAGFTGSFDPTVGLIGALSANSIMGLQRGYIGMRGLEPAATRGDDGVIIATDRALGRTRTDGGAGSADQPDGNGRPTTLAQPPEAPTKSTSELIQEVRARDVSGYREARDRDHAAMRSDTPPAQPRAHRDAHLAEQRSTISELSRSQRAVLNAELDQVRARSRATTPDDPALTFATERLGAAQLADARVRSDVERALSDSAAPAPVSASRARTDAEASDTIASTELPPHRRAESGEDQAITPAPRRDTDMPEDSADVAGSETTPPQRDRASSSHHESHARRRSTDDGSAEHDSTGDRRRSTDDDSTAESAPRRSTADDSTDAPLSRAAEAELANADGRIADLKAAQVNSARALDQANARGLEQATTRRDLARADLAHAKRLNDADNEMLVRRRGDEESAPDELRPTMRAAITDLERQIAARDRHIDDTAARVAIAEQQLSTVRAPLDRAADEQDRAMAAARKAVGDLPSPSRGEGEQFTNHAARLRAELDELTTTHDNWRIESGVAQRRIEAELAALDASSRTERSMIDGGYMSGKPRPRKLPLDHTMPDPFSAPLPPAGFDFWLTGGPDAQPTPLPTDDEHPDPEPDQPPEPD
ncbi:hypothetical protein [Nocardia alba]|uniref:Outer membrane channel protein CpnT-like N-terminal domain-containing protein n=1 Tax=Nocardia alba TaxID=225051 RepID=A0A4R1FSC4_9NOCA|nr:hypothetical protein [Nocardia alba]TCJ97743.1 hypothetical protein DFR71_3792 [Nocardia alba]